MHVPNGFVPPPPWEPEREQRARLARMPLPVLGFVEQPTLEDVSLWSIESADVAGERVRMAVSISSTLWRHPDDRGDPRNLAILDDATAAALESSDDRSLPPWLREARQRIRLPLLWEAVRTTWMPAEHRRPIRDTLVEHLQHVVRDRVPGAHEPRQDRPDVAAAGLSAVEVEVDGRLLPGRRLDGEHAIGIGVDLGEAQLTVAVLREHLSFVRLAFATRWRPQTISDDA
ncbi:hypothetical protein [Agrococcus sp. SGAir0287]|uniref:hypothetical protein n=1 Tax=Agrococcus sp. SGAir0287 TaxID=2070347 RepID=UPI0010CCC551|nr:hypothetical protein [Agrococcus sp. SGAir0287]QCR19158.1 hypothetical protein C1N71_06660 [Agrococcus sp. SGAir0287]